MRVQILPGSPEEMTMTQDKFVIFQDAMKITDFFEKPAIVARMTQSPTFGWRDFDRKTFATRDEAQAFIDAQV